MADAWGPSAWKFLHSLTFSYPDTPTLEEQTNAEKLFTSLKYLLPCSSCRDHYISELNNNPPDTSSKLRLSSWLVDLHNRVNVRLGKPIVSMAQATQMFSGQCNINCDGTSRSLRETSSNSSSMVLFFVFLLLLGGVFFYMNYYKKKIKQV